MPRTRNARDFGSLPAALGTASRLLGLPLLILCAVLFLAPALRPQTMTPIKLAAAAQAPAQAIYLTATDPVDPWQTSAAPRRLVFSSVTAASTPQWVLGSVPKGTNGDAFIEPAPVFDVNTGQTLVKLQGSWTHFPTASDGGQLTLAASAALPAGDYISYLDFHDKSAAGPVRSHQKLFLRICAPHKLSAAGATPTEPVCLFPSMGYLFRGLLGVTHDGPQFALGIKNDAPSPAEVTEVSLFVAGPDNLVAVNKTQAAKYELLPGQQSIALDVSGPEELSAGQYTGTAQLFLTDPQETVSIPFNLDVRHSPVWALLVILAGLGLGFAARWTNSQQSTYFDQLDAISEGIDELPGPLKKELNEQIRVLTFRIKTTPTDPAIGTDLTTLQASMVTARTIEYLNSQGQGKFDARQATWTALVGDARQKVISGQPLSASQDIGTMEAYLAHTEMIPAPPAPADQNAAAAEIQPAEAQPPAPTGPPIPDPRTKLLDTTMLTRSRSRLKLGLTDQQLKDRHRKLQWVRTMVACGAMLILVATGMQKLYVPGFGHSIFDYLTVVIWGFSAGLAGKGLSNTITSSTFSSP